jgi:hypothetical protein
MWMWQCKAFYNCGDADFRKWGYLRGSTSHLAKESRALLSTGFGRRFLGGGGHRSRLLLVAHGSGGRSRGGGTRRRTGSASWSGTATTGARHCGYRIGVTF